MRVHAVPHCSAPAPGIPASLHTIARLHLFHTSPARRLVRWLTRHCRSTQEGRSRRFRERRLSKDNLPVEGSPQQDIADDVYVPQAALLGQGSGRDTSPNGSPNSARCSTTSHRRFSLNEIVDEGADILSAAHVRESSPGPRDSVAMRHSRSTPGSPTIEPASPRLLRASGESTDSQQANKPSMQPRTAESARKAQLIRGPHVAISREMGEEDEGEVFDLPEAVVGSYSCHGMEPGEDGGVDKINQDCACMGYPFAGLERSALFCVYDGHGKFGHEASQEAMHTVYHMLEVAHKELMADPCGTLADAFEACNVHLRIMACEEVLEVNALESGACAVVAFLHHQELFVAGVGDCRVVLGATGEDGAMVPVQLSTDHKVDLPAEQMRLESKGAWVRPAADDSDGDFFPARLYEDKAKPHLGPGLCISRSLGDLNALRSGVIPTPEVFSHVITDDDKFLILATDGVWEFISNEEAVAIVRDFHQQSLPAIDACRLLIAKAAIQWRREEGDYRDDITAMCAAILHARAHTRTHAHVHTHARPSWQYAPPAPGSPLPVAAIICHPIGYARVSLTGSST